MSTYSYKYPQYLINRETGRPLENATGGRLLDKAGNEVLTTDMAGVPCALTTGPTGLLSEVLAPVKVGVAVFGENRSTYFSDDAIDSSDQAAEAVQLATAAKDAAERLAVNSTTISFIKLSPDGRVLVTDTPVAVGGGQPVIRNGSVFIQFPN